MKSCNVKQIKVWIKEIEQDKDMFKVMKRVIDKVKKLPAINWKERK